MVGYSNSRYHIKSRQSSFPTGSDLRFLSSKLLRWKNPFILAMGHSHLHNNHHHQATDGLMNLFTKANHDLSVVHHKLEKEFSQTYPDNANPIMLVSRIKKVQDDLLLLKERCREVLSAKQDLIDKARIVLVGNRSLVQQLQSSTGLAVTKESDDASYFNFEEVIDEWTAQVRSNGNEEHDKSSSEDINKLLFSAIVQDN